MSFTSTSVFLIFIILGQLSHQVGETPLTELKTKEDVSQALKVSCTDLSKAGPLADINFKQIIEFQRKSLIRLERKKQEFVKNHCEKQKKEHQSRSLISQNLEPRNEPQLLTDLTRHLVEIPKEDSSLADKNVQLAELKNLEIKNQIPEFEITALGLELKTVQGEPPTNGVELPIRETERKNSFDQEAKTPQTVYNAVRPTFNDLELASETPSNDTGIEFQTPPKRHRAPGLVIQRPPYESQREVEVSANDSKELDKDIQNQPKDSLVSATETENPERVEQTVETENPESDEQAVETEIQSPETEEKTPQQEKETAVAQAEGPLEESEEKEAVVEKEIVEVQPEVEQIAVEEVTEEVKEEIKEVEVEKEEVEEVVEVKEEEEEEEVKEEEEEEEVKEEPFVCDNEEALADFSKEFGSEQEDALENQLKIFADFRLPDLIEFWDYFCENTPNEPLPSNIQYLEIARQYNELLSETEKVDLSFLDQFRTSRGADIYDDQGRWMGPFIDQGKVVDFVPSKDIPDVLKQAFVAAEDKNFYKHRGVEPQGVLRGFFKYLKDGSIEGGSTITQQLVKNLIIGNDISLERKSREMLLARRVENRINKEEILEAYLNIVNLGRGAQGIGTAVKRYFGSNFSVRDMTLNEASYFAGLTHSPTRYNPISTPISRIKTRQSYVLKQMIQAKMISEAEAKASLEKDLPFAPLVFPRMSYFQAAVSEEYLKTTPQDTETPQKIISTQDTYLQNQVNSLVQEKLSNFEMTSGKVYWRGPLRNISYLWENLEERPSILEETSIWKNELIKSQSLFPGVNWDVVVVLSTQGEIKIGRINASGEAEVKNLSFGDVGTWSTSIRNRLQTGDVIFAQQKGELHFFRVPPTLQSSVVVMDVNTGEVKALSGGFDYSLSPYNRAIKSIRQPGSTVKPFTYLAALNSGMKVDDLVSKGPVHFRKKPGCNAWSPGSGGDRSNTSAMSFESGLVHSNNRLTANLLYSIYSEPQQSLEYVYNIMLDFGLYDYSEDDRICYPIILGSNDVSLLRLANAYAAIANGGWLMKPTFLKNTEKTFNGRRLSKTDALSIGTLSQILSKVVTEGTGEALKQYGGIIAGKTGTSNAARDVWFVGYSNHHVVAAWIGYDTDRIKGINGQNIYLNMGENSTGGRLVAPLVGDIFNALFTPRTEQVSALDPATPLNYQPSQYAFNQIWPEQVLAQQFNDNQVAGFQQNEEPWYSIDPDEKETETETPPTDSATSVARSSFSDPVNEQDSKESIALNESTEDVDSPSAEVIEVLKEDSLQRLKRKRDQLMNLTNEGD